jgi:hypothetical protein
LVRAVLKIGKYIVSLSDEKLIVFTDDVIVSGEADE